MPGKEWLKENPVYAGVGAGVLLLISAVIVITTLFSSGHEPSTSSKFYYYDMKTGELFVDEANLIPPIKAPSGGEGVIAEVYACGDCSDELYVGVLRKYSDAAKRAIEQELPPDPSGELVRLADANSRWVAADSQAGQQLRLSSVATARERCQGQEPTICFPK